MATQSLAYIDSDLAFAISHVYAAQQQLDGSTRGVTQAMYATADAEAFLRNGLATYFGDCVLMEPRLLAIYDQVLPQIDRALGEPPANNSGAIRKVEKGCWTVSAVMSVRAASAPACPRIHPGGGRKPGNRNGRHHCGVRLPECAAVPAVPGRCTAGATGPDFGESELRQA